MFGQGAGFDMYVLEKEGVLSTREGRLNAAIKEIEAYRGGTSEINAILKKYNLGRLSDSELARVIRASGLR